LSKSIILIALQIQTILECNAKGKGDYRNPSHLQRVNLIAPEDHYHPAHINAPGLLWSVKWKDALDSHMNPYLQTISIIAAEWNETLTYAP
jgi:hypothetical protein